MSLDISKINHRILGDLKERRWTEEEIAAMTPEQAFDEFCQWNGLIGWGRMLYRAAHELAKAVQP